MSELADDLILPVDSPSRTAVIATLASAALPGAGQFVLRRKRTGLVFVGIFIIIAICFWPLRIGSTYYGYCVATLAMVALFITSSVSALRARTGSEPKWLWLCLSLPLAFVVASIFVLLLMFAAGLHGYKVASSSMEPTIFSGDTIITDLHAYKESHPQRGDILVFGHNGYTIIKRLIGLPGDKISSSQGIITRNGVKLEEPYAVHDGADVSEQMQNFDEVVVPDGQIFVLGDNRDHSLDSRLGEFGKVTFNDVRGNVRYVIASKHDQTGRRFP